MRSTAKDIMVRRFHRLANLERKDNENPPISRSRFQADVDYNQLTVRSSETLVDTDGVFWFIPGFSIVGGPDRVVP